MRTGIKGGGRGAYVQTKVLGQLRPEVAPDDDVAVAVVEGFIFAVVLRHRPNGHVGDAGGV